MRISYPKRKIPGVDAQIRPLWRPAFFVWSNDAVAGQGFRKVQGPPGDLMYGNAVKTIS